MTDTATFGLDVVAGFGAKIGDLTDELRRTRQSRIDSLPVDYRRVGQGIVPSGGGTIVIGLGSPPPGHLWLIRRIIVGGVTWGTAAAGTAEVYIVALPSSQIAISRDLGALVDEAAAMPNKAYYSNRQLVAVNPESVHVVIVNGTASQQYVATIQAEDYVIGKATLDEYVL